MSDGEIIIGESLGKDNFQGVSPELIAVCQSQFDMNVIYDLYNGLLQIERRRQYILIYSNKSVISSVSLEFKIFNIDAGKLLRGLP